MENGGGVSWDGKKSNCFVVCLIRKKRNIKLCFSARTKEAASKKKLIPVQIPGASAFGACQGQSGHRICRVTPGPQRGCFFLCRSGEDE